MAGRVNERIRTMVGHWRALTPAQEAAIRRGYGKYRRARWWADQYGVSVRTIYRTLHRVEYDTAELSVFGRRAVFQLVDDQPVQVTPWVAA